MGVLYITSQNDGVGKTTLTAALVGILKDSGKKAIGLIPSREGDLVDTERDILSRLLGEEIGGPSYSSKDTLISAIVDAGAKSDFVIVEGPGNVGQADHIDIVSKTEAKAIVVSDFIDGDSCLEFARDFGSALAGVVINCRTRYGRTEMADKLTPVLLIGLVSALGFSVFSVSLRWRKETPKFTTVAIAGLFCAIFSSIVLTLSDANFLTTFKNSSLSALHGLLVCCGLILYSIGSKELPAADLTLLSLTEVIGGIFWVWLPIFGINEIPSENTIIGGVIITFAIFYYSFFIKRNKRFIGLN